MKTYFKVGDTAYFVSWDNQIIEGKIEKILDSDYDYPVIFKTETVSYTFTHEGKHRKENNFISLFQQKPKIIIQPNIPILDTEFKVGDKVACYFYGEGVVKYINDSENYPIAIKFIGIKDYQYYTVDGKANINHKNPVLKKDMNYKYLNKDEKKLIKNKEELNKRRDLLQTLAVNEIAVNKKQIINFFTSAGKTYLVKNCILRMQKYFLNDNPYVVVVNSDVLKEEFEKVLDGIPNVECYIVNTFVKDRITFGEVNAVFFDEAHHYLNEDSLEFKKTIPKIDCSYKVLLSATLEKEQLNYAESLGFNHNFLVDTNEALFMNLIPDYIIYNLGLELEGFYKTQYENIDKTFKDYVAYFKAVIPERTEFVVANLIKPENKLLLEEVTGLLNEFYDMEYSVGQVMGMVMKYYKSISNRKKFLDSCKIKIDVCKKLIAKAENLDLQTVVFTGNKLVGKSLLTKNAEVYFSESNLKVIDNFARGITKTIISCNKLVEGQISNNIEFVLRTNFNNKKRYFQQSKGRGLRFSEKEKYLIVVNVYLKNTQEETWLKNQTKNEKFINYVEKIEQIAF